MPRKKKKQKGGSDFETFAVDLIDEYESRPRKNIMVKNCDIVTKLDKKYDKIYKGTIYIPAFFSILNDENYKKELSRIATEAVREYEFNNEAEEFLKILYFIWSNRNEEEFLKLMFFAMKNLKSGYYNHYDNSKICKYSSSLKKKIETFKTLCNSKVNFQNYLKLLCLAYHINSNNDDDHEYRGLKKELANIKLNDISDIPEDNFSILYLLKKVESNKNDTNRMLEDNIFKTYDTDINKKIGGENGIQKARSIKEKLEDKRKSEEGEACEEGEAIETIKNFTKDKEKYDASVLEQKSRLVEKGFVPGLVEEDFVSAKQGLKEKVEKDVRNKGVWKKVLTDKREKVKKFKAKKEDDVFEKANPLCKLKTKEEWKKLPSGSRIPLPNSGHDCVMTKNDDGFITALEYLPVQTERYGYEPASSTPSSTPISTPTSTSTPIPSQKNESKSRGVETLYTEVSGAAEHVRRMEAARKKGGKKTRKKKHKGKQTKHRKTKRNHNKTKRRKQTKRHKKH